VGAAAVVGSGAGAQEPSATPQPPREPPHLSTETPSARLLLDGFGDEPSIDEVQRAAQRRARSLILPRRCARRAGWLPDLTLQIERRLGRDDDLNYLTRRANDPLESVVESSARQQLIVRGRVDWRLDRLAFDPMEPRLAELEARVEAATDDTVADVTRLYFDRRRLQVEQRLAPSADELEFARKELRIRELGASIDALTGGLLSGRSRWRAGAHPTPSTTHTAVDPRPPADRDDRCADRPLPR
jgi:hypothetical protein